MGCAERRRGELVDELDWEELRDVDEDARIERVKLQARAKSGGTWEEARGSDAVGI